MVPIKQGQFAFQIQLQRCKTSFSLVKPQLLLPALTKGHPDSHSLTDYAGDVGPLAVFYKNIPKGSLFRRSVFVTAAKIGKNLSYYDISHTLYILCN